MMIDANVALPALRASTAALLHGVEGERWTDDDVRAPSLLPGWSRGHVLTHIARNADGISRAVSGALRGEIVARYPDGRAGRDADIEAGARRGSVDLLTDVRESADRLDRVFAAVAEADGWELPTEDRTIGEYAVARWREVEVHRLDLGGTYTAADWPPEFVSYLVPELAVSIARRSEAPLQIAVSAEGSVTADLPGRTWSSDASDASDRDAMDVRGPDWAVLAWLIGRPGATAGQLSAVPELKAWL